MIIFKQELGFIQVQEPNEFSETVQNYFAPTHGHCISRSASYNYMEGLLCFSINSKNTHDLMKFISSIFYGDYESEFNEAAELIRVIDNERELDIIYAAYQLMTLLNNAKSNLRLGFQSWNQAIGSHYDPTAWCYVENRKILSSSAPKSDHNGFIPGIEHEDGFYLVDPTDSMRLTTLLSIPVDFENSLSLFTAKEKDTGVPFIYSSSNETPFIPLDFSKPCAIPIFYKSNGEWIAIPKVIPPEEI